MTVQAVFPIAPLERSGRVITLAGVVVAGGGAVLLALTYRGGLVALLGAPSLLFVLVIAPLAFSPAGYALGEADLAVLRRARGPLLFPLASLVAARPTAMPHSARMGGSGGLFGWWGRFSNRSWGQFRAYATDRRRGVLLEWPGFKLFVSPEDPDGFCRGVLDRRAALRRRR